MTLLVLVSCLGDVSVPADFLSISLGMGLSIILKAGGGMLKWLQGAMAQWSEHLQLKQEALGSIPGDYPLQVQPAYRSTNTDGMKDPYGALVQFGCYQHNVNGRVCGALLNLTAINTDK